MPTAIRSHALGVTAVIWFAVGTPTHAQLIKNPTGLAFTCPDHATDDGHEVDIVRETDGVVVQTLPIGDPPLTAGEVIVAINVQPIAFGEYRFVARARAGMFSSDNSVPSAVWQRAPGRPSGLIVR